MTIHTCACGARFRLTDSAFGKTIKCKRCGAKFVLRAVSTTPQGKGDTTQPASQTAAGVATNDRDDAPASRTESSLCAVSERQSQSAAVREPKYTQPVFVRSDYARFADDALKALQFPISLNNLIIFAFVWLLICLKSFLNLGMNYRGAFGVAVLAAWFGAYRLQIVENAAGGDHELPPMSLSHGFVGDVLSPFTRWLGSWLVVLWPSAIYAGYLAYQGVLRPFDLLTMASSGLGGLLMGGLADQPILSVLIFAGLFLWPVVVLCVAIGDFACLWRIDLIGKTLFRTLPSYLLVTASVFAAFFTQSILEREFGPNYIGLAFTVYFEIVACKIIGLYYHCFKERFAWSWD